MTSNTSIYNPFRIYKNNTSSTEYASLDVSSLSTNRTVTMPDAPVDVPIVRSVKGTNGAGGGAKIVLTVSGLATGVMCLLRIEAVAVDTGTYTPEALITYRTIQGNDAPTVVTVTSIIDESTNTSWTVDTATPLNYIVKVAESRSYALKVSVLSITGAIPTITLA